MGTGIRRLLSAASVMAMALGPVLVSTTPASADIVTPAGACVGSGHWEKANFTQTSTDRQPGDLIKVPQADTVSWAGNISGFKIGDAGPRRAISGEVQLDLPVGTATIDRWGGASMRYANKGQYAYNLPNVLVGIKMTLHGAHRDNGKTTCSGSVSVQVEGSAFSNPLAFAGLGGLALSGGALFFAGRPVVKKLWAFEDVNPG